LSKVLTIEEFLIPDQLGTRISNYYLTWEAFRQTKLAAWDEVQRYVFATSTKDTSNSKLPWSNTTTIPKLCQIRDNLNANYMATMFPRRKNVTWIGYSQSDEQKELKKTIENYMCYNMEQPEFINEIGKCVLDYIDYGNAFVMVDWVDYRITDATKKTTVGFVGPRPRRISPLDIVFDPTAPTFVEAPKIIRSLITMGEVKELLDRNSLTPEQRDANEELWAYIKDRRSQIRQHTGSLSSKDTIYSIAGFNSFQAYMSSDTVEILTFYGDIYDQDSQKFIRNQIIQIVDRHKIVSQVTNPSFMGYAPIHHVGWRVRPDNLWAMGPLDNLVGMQYRIDHLENIKADVFDLIAYPPIKVRGYADDFVWGPMERIVVYDDGDVELMSPQVQAMQADTQIAILEQKMEEMAGSPKEAMGFRTPGEKTKYEVQRLENAASRIFQAKTAQFERDFVEPMLNDMLEMARRNLDEVTVRSLDPDYNFAVFSAIGPLDISGNGRIRPVAARHFAEQAQLVQDLNAFLGSPAGQDPSVLMHFSAVKLAETWNQLLDIEDFNIFSPYIRITENADAARLANVTNERQMNDSSTASGLGGDADPNALSNAQATSRVDQASQGPPTA